MAIDYPSLDNPTAGAFRFNTDSSQMEIYDGNQWTGVVSDSPELQTGGTRILNGGGNTSPAYVNTIDYFHDPTPGNSVDFGNLTSNRNVNNASCGSRTRGLFAGDAGGYDNTIDYVTITTTGNAVDFGDKNTQTMSGSALSTQTRGLFVGGYVPGGAVNVMDYVAISSTGNSTDFGDLMHVRYAPSCASSKTRGIIAGTDITPATNSMEFFTMSTTGNGSEFGDLPVTRLGSGQGGANATRMIIPLSKDSGGSAVNTVHYVNIATLGNSLDFGDMTSAKGSFGAAASRVNYFICGSPGSDTIEKCTIMTLGNFVDFATLSQARYGAAGVSNGHGGL